MAGTHHEVDSIPQEQLLNGECGTAGARLAQRAAGRRVVVRAERREAQAGRLLLCRRKKRREERRRNKRARGWEPVS